MNLFIMFYNFIKKYQLILNSKAMCNLEIYVITCYAEIYLNGIPTVRNLTEINSISKTRKLRGNVTEILMELLNRNA